MKKPDYHSLALGLTIELSPAELKEGKNLLKQLNLQRQAIRSRTVMLVDDESFILEALEFALRAKFGNITIRKFQDSEEAWRELSQSDPALLIVRDRMAGMTGREIVGRLVERKATFPIIVGGGWPATEEWVRECANENPNVVFLPYPFSPEQLYLTLPPSLSL